jgi:hypothetical protein
MEPDRIMLISEFGGKKETLVAAAAFYVMCKRKIFHRKKCVWTQRKQIIDDTKEGLRAR